MMGERKKPTDLPVCGQEEGSDGASEQAEGQRLVDGQGGTDA
jgi:hypothetical protein